MNGCWPFRGTTTGPGGVVSFFRVLNPKPAKHPQGQGHSRRLRGAQGVDHPEGPIAIRRARAGLHLPDSDFPDFLFERTAGDLARRCQADHPAASRERSAPGNQAGSRFPIGALRLPRTAQHRRRKRGFLVVHECLRIDFVVLLFEYLHHNWICRALVHNNTTRGARARKG